MRMKPSSSIIAMSRHVPLVAQDLAGGLGIGEIADHAPRPFQQQQAFDALAPFLVGIGVDHLGGDAGYRMADRPRLVPGLTLARLRHVGHIDRDDRDHLGHAIAFQHVVTELFLEGGGEVWPQGSAPRPRGEWWEVLAHRTVDRPGRRSGSR
jgi:hypothetical protein